MNESPGSAETVPAQKKVHIETWGCQMNAADSERMLAMLAAQNYTLTQTPDDADLVLLNTCHIREKARHKVLSRLGVLRELKERSPGMTIAVAGCVAQAEGRRLLQAAPQIDVLFGPGKIDELPRLLREHAATRRPALAIGFQRPAAPTSEAAASSEVGDAHGATGATAAVGAAGATAAVGAAQATAAVGASGAAGATVAVGAAGATAAGATAAVGASGAAGATVAVGAAGATAAGATAAGATAAVGAAGASADIGVAGAAVAAGFTTPAAWTAPALAPAAGSAEANLVPKADAAPAELQTASKASPTQAPPTLSGKLEISRYVNIQQGCNNYCTFCVVPFTRGRELSRSEADILDECRALIAAGARELTLLGQNVNSYGEGLAGAPNFAGLLRAVAALPGYSRLRFTTSNPHDFTAELAALFGSEAKLGRYLHLPVQSGHDRTLERMQRKVTVATYLERIAWLRAALPDIALSTDLIVGFPGETDEEFAATLALVEQVRFSFAFTFKYSPRKNTPAARYGDQVPEAVKEERLARLMRLQERITTELHAAEIGQVRPVLFHYESSKHPGQFYGRTEHFNLVRVDSARPLTGLELPVLITQSNKVALLGELVDSPHAAHVGATYTSLGRRSGSVTTQ